jgi:mannose-1-phosphate guanylyltransferase
VVVTRAPSALLLTAGLGTRLDPLTRLVAKPAVPLGDCTLVEHVVAWLCRYGVTDVVLNLHHLPETITRVVGDGAHLGVRARYSWEQPVLGSAGGPRHALPLLAGESFLIVNGDTLCDVDLAALAEDHARSGAEVTMAVVPNPAPARYNGIMIDDTNQVVGFTPKGPHAAGNWHFVGVQMVRARVFAGLADGQPAETVAGIYREMVLTRPGSIRAWLASPTFIDIGTPADYLSAAAHLGGLREHDVAVWPGATVDVGASLEACIVAAGVRVPAAFAARRAVLVPAALARPGDRADVRDGIAVFAIDHDGSLRP